jgi:tetratricopeptide (TPR) repeat protein
MWDKVTANRRFALFVMGLFWSLLFSGCATQKVETPEEPTGKADSLMKMGDVYFREGKYRFAMKNYLDADALNPHIGDLKFRIALLYADYYNKLDEAVRYYQEATELRKNYSEAYNNLGTVYARQDKWDLAIESYTKALDNLFYSTPEKAYYNMAAAYQGKGERAKAIDHYKMAIELKPEYVEPYLQLALLYQEQGQYTEAVHTLDQARSVMEKAKPVKENVTADEWNEYQSTLASTYYYQAKALLQLQRDPEAREALQKALEITPDEALRERIEQELKALP